MKKFLITATAALLMVVGYATAEKVHDWHDLEETHNHIKEALHEMERAQKANHYDMGGHAAKAEQLMRDAEHELGLAIQARQNTR